MNSDALTVDANPALSPNAAYNYSQDTDTINMIGYIHKSSQIILKCRQIFNHETKTEKNEEFQLNVANCEILKNEIYDKYLRNWNPHQSSLTFTIDISLQIINNNDNDNENEIESKQSEFDKPQLIEQWKLVFNHATSEHLDDNKNKKNKKKDDNKIDIETQLNNQMILQLRSLMAYLQLLPLQNILTPTNTINTMDLFNLGVDVESDEDLANGTDDGDNNVTPYKLSYRLSSAYEQSINDNDSQFPYPSNSKLYKKNNDEKARFHDYDEVDYYLFPLLQFGETGSLQLSVFYLNIDKFNSNFIENNDNLSQFITTNNIKKKLNNKYLGMKVNQYIEEKKQQQIVLNAIEENKNIDINDEEEALYVDEDEYENDKLLDDNDNDQQPLLPKVTIKDDNIINGKDDQKSKDKKPGKMSQFFGKMMESSSRNIGYIKSEMNKIKINIPRPCNLCIQILTQNVVKIGWKSDKSLKDYDTSTNTLTKKFKFEVRSKKVVKSKDNDLEQKDIIKMIENRPIIIRETFGESLVYKDLEPGEVYKFQVRILDNINTTFMSKWSGTLSVVVPGGNEDDLKDEDDTANEEVMEKDHRKMIEALKLEEIQNLCSELLKKVTLQQTKIAQHDEERKEWENNLNLVETEKNAVLDQLTAIQRNLRIKSNQYNELNITSEEDDRFDVEGKKQDVLLRKNIPNIISLAKQWTDLKLDVHLKIWVYLCNELKIWYKDETNKRAEVAFEILFDIVMYCYKEMMRQEHILGDFEDNDEEDEKEVTSHDILINMDILFMDKKMNENSTATPGGDDDVDDIKENENGEDEDENEDNQNAKQIYSNFCHRIVNTVIFNALRDKKSKWFKYKLLQKKEIEFALNDYVCECCRIIWCLLSLSKNNYHYILYPTEFKKRSVGKSKSKSKIKMIDIEFGIDNYGDFDDVKMNDDDNDRIIVENDKSIKIDKMDIYDEKIHKKEMGSTHNEKHIEYCSWPSIVKASPSKEQSSSSHLFGRLTNSDINSGDDDYQFLTRSFVFCCL